MTRAWHGMKILPKLSKLAKIIITNFLKPLLDIKAWAAAYYRSDLISYLRMLVKIDSKKTSRHAAIFVYTVKYKRLLWSTRRWYFNPSELIRLWEHDEYYFLNNVKRLQCNDGEADIHQLLVFGSEKNIFLYRNIDEFDFNLRYRHGTEFSCAWDDLLFGFLLRWDWRL